MKCSKLILALLFCFTIVSLTSYFSINVNAEAQSTSAIENETVYTITLIVDGESTTVSQIYSQPIYLTEPTKNGMAFDGWYTKANGEGNKIENGLLYRTQGDMTLYAHFVSEPISPYLLVFLCVGVFIFVIAVFFLLRKISLNRKD